MQETRVGLEELVAQLTAERDQLAAALESRIVIEQAKGVLAERYGLSVAHAFLLLRQSARGAQMKIHSLAELVVTRETTPEAVIRGLARESKWRAAAMRERNEATLERTREIHEESMRRRLENEGSKLRIRTTSRWDALDLGRRLPGLRWYLVAPSEHVWDVVVELPAATKSLPAKVGNAITRWRSERGVAEPALFLDDTPWTRPT